MIATSIRHFLFLRKAEEPVNEMSFHGAARQTVVQRLDGVDPWTASLGPWRRARA